MDGITSQVNKREEALFRARSTQKVEASARRRMDSDDSESDTNNGLPDSSSDEEDDDDLTLDEIMQRIKENDPGSRYYALDGRYYVERSIQTMTDEKWEQLGRDISNNTHLEYICLSGVALNDRRMSCLFRGLTRSSSIDDMN